MNTQLPTIEDNDNWARCFATFIQHLWSLSHSSDTIYAYRHILSAFFSVGKHPSDYTRADVLDFINRPTQGQRSRGKPPSTATVNQRLYILKSWFAWATEYTVESPDGRPERLLKTLPPTTGLRAGQPLRSPKSLSTEELERLFSVIPRDTVKGARDYTIILWYAISARRRMELARLTWGSIKDAILVDANGTRRNGHVFTFQGKGRSQEDDIQELSPLVHQALMTYLEMSGRLSTMKDTDPLFVATDLNRGLRFDQSRPLNDATIAHSFKRYCKLASLSPKYSLHSLRHSSAQIRYALGEDIFSISRTLRHASLQTTTIYLNSSVAPVDKGARALEIMFSRFS